MTTLLVDLAFAAVAIGIAWLAARLLVWQFGAPAPMGRFLPLDGLRGLLAVSVMVHHSAIWYGYIKTGQWVLPVSPVFAELGQGSVLMFFMITSFLFTGKILNAHGDVDWRHLLVSRIFRLTPLYWFAMLCMLLLVGVSSHWQLRESLPQLWNHLSTWLAYTISGYPDINHVADTWRLVAGVTWTLVYEWMFYLALPLLALLMGRKPGWLPVVVSLLALWWLLDRWHPNLRMIVVFVLGGLTAGVVVKKSWLNQFATSVPAHWLVLLTILTVLLVFHTAYDIWPTLMLWMVFTMIASGNTLFGLLVNPATRQLGDQAYSIYLLHGMALYVVFHVLLGEMQVREWTFVTYWTTLLSVVPVVVGVSFVTWRGIERNGMLLGQRLSVKIVSKMHLSH